MSDKALEKFSIKAEVFRECQSIMAENLSLGAEQNFPEADPKTNDVDEVLILDNKEEPSGSRSSKQLCRSTCHPSRKRKCSRSCLYRQLVGEISNLKKKLKVLQEIKEDLMDLYGEETVENNGAS